MKRKLTTEFINAQPVLASSLRCLPYRLAGIDLFYQSRDACSWCVMGAGTTGSGKTFDMPSALNRITQAEPRLSDIPNDAGGIFCNAVPYRFYSLQHIEKGWMS